MSEPMAPKRVVERFVAEVINNDRAGAMDELVAEAELREGVAWFKQAFPDHALEVRKLLAAEDDHVAAQFVASGTHLGVLEGIPTGGDRHAATGRRFEVPLTAIYKIDEGRISGHWLVWDWLSILHQIGVARTLERPAEPPASIDTPRAT